MSSPISQSDRLKRVLQRPEFKGFAQFLFAMPSPYNLIANYSFKTLCTKIIPTWNAESMISGLDCVIRNINNGVKFLYHFYTEEEKEDDSSKKNTALFHFPSTAKNPFVIICAGGAYMSVAHLQEAFPIAEAINGLGFSAFVLHYRTGKDAKAPNPIDDLARAVQFILDNADDLGIAKDDYAVMGFSAGGHLAASFGTKTVGYSRYGLPKPKALLLGYPVITMGEFTHKMSRKYLLGRDSKDQSICDKYSVEKNIDGDYPPTYVWMCNADSEVDPRNSLALIDDLQKAGVGHKMKSVKGTAHGWGIGIGTPAEGWLSEAVGFWRGC